MKFYIKHTIALCLLVFLGFAGMTQDIINEDFLDNIESNAAGLWSDAPPAFAVIKTPEKYNSESAVILGFKRNVSIDKKSRMGFLSKGERSLYFVENVRFRIKLNDNNSVGTYSTIYFRYGDKQDGFSAKVIKADGTIQNVSLNEAVEVESTSNMPEFFKSFFDQQRDRQNWYYKVAINDLEPGDILEYVANTRSKIDVSRQGYIEFSPQYEVCTKNYPILYNQISIETDNNSSFKSLSKNGAPDFIKENTSESGLYRFVFTDRERGVEKDVNFISPYQVYPFVKFQVIFSNRDNVKGSLMGEKGEIKAGFTKQELSKKAWEDYVKVGDTYYNSYSTVQNLVNEMWAGLKKQGAKEWSEKEYINKVYYRIRNFIVNQNSYWDDKMVAYLFGSLLYQKDIKSELIISISNSIGNINDILFDSEVRYLCKVGDKYFFNCTDFSNPEDLVESLLGSTAYIIREPGKGGIQAIEEIKLPSTAMDDNVSVLTANASLNIEKSLVTVSRISAYKGLAKTREIPTALKYIPYMLNDYKYYGGEGPTEKMKPAQEEEYYNAVKALKDNFKAAKPDFVKGQLESEFGKKVEYKNFTINTDGRSSKENELNFTEEFIVHDMVRKAGKKILVNIPGLIGSQLSIKKEERDQRKYDINVSLPRVIKWVINFKIPEGYTAEGLQELNVTKENETALFSCVAEEKEGKIILNIKKAYKKMWMPKSDWADLLQVVDTAYNSSFKYILLKPKN
ncbi:MAG: hypothetical protein H7Y86_01510 [Rhizobacter sp.]|nr:hypothetical protein [Ferruginibacter sp.]